MCVVSNVFDSYSDRWRIPPTTGTGAGGFTYTPAPLTAEEIRKMIEEVVAAREQDIAEGNPDCGLAEKKERLLDVLQTLEDRHADLLADILALRTVIEEL